MKKLYSIVKYLLLLLLAAALLKLSFRGVEWGDFWSGVKSANYTFIILSMTVAIVVTLLRAARWRLIMLPIDSEITLKESWHGVNIGYLTNFVIPRGGEVARCAVITNLRGSPFDKIAGSVILERAIDLLSLFIITVTTLLLNWGKFGAFFKREIVSSANTQLIITVLAILTASLLLILLLLLIFRKRLIKYKLFRKVASFLKGIIEGVIAGIRLPQKWAFIGYTVAIWISYWLMSLFTIWALPGVEGLTGLDALFLMVVGSFGWVVPVQGGIGAYHFIISLALSTIYSIEQTSGVIFATISHESQLLIMLLLGFTSLIALSLSGKKKDSVKRDTHG